MVLRSRPTFSLSKFRDWKKRERHGLKVLARKGSFQFDRESLEDVVVAEISGANKYNGEGLDEPCIL